jgi:hypothetical protein
MLTDIYYKKTEKCNKYPAMLATKTIAQMPLLTVNAGEMDSKWIVDHSLEEPVLLVGSNEDMGISLLDRDIKLSKVAAMLGPKTPVKIIEVGLQSEITGKTFIEYATYLERRGPQHKVLNLISLEISNTPLTAHIEAPRFVREEVDWIDAVWPLDRRARGGDYPQVQKYLLTGMAGSYTDFHVDFGVSCLPIFWLMRVCACIDSLFVYRVSYVGHLRLVQRGLGPQAILLYPADSGQPQGVRAVDLLPEPGARIPRGPHRRRARRRRWRQALDAAAALLLR